MGDCPVMNAARPAVQLCWPYQSVKSAPSLGDAVDVGRLVAHHAVVVGADVELADVVAPDDEDVRLGGGGPRRNLGWGGRGLRMRWCRKHHDGQYGKRGRREAFPLIH